MLNYFLRRYLLVELYRLLSGDLVVNLALKRFDYIRDTRCSCVVNSVVLRTLIILSDEVLVVGC